MSRRNAQCEFQKEAADESLRIVEMHGAQASDDHSLCIPTTDTDPTCLRRFGYAVVIRSILGLLGFVGGAVLAFLVERANDGHADSAWTVVGLCAMVGGILVWLSNPFLQRRFVRRHIGVRYQDMILRFSTRSPVCIGVEDATTFRKAKLLPEDLGYLALDRSRRLLVIEGIRYRYLIHGKDTHAVQQVAGGPTTATAIEYAVGETTLCIALQHESLWHELKRVTVGVKGDSLIDRIRDTLGTDETLTQV